MAEIRVRLASFEDLVHVVALDRATELLPHWTESQYAAAVAPAVGDLRRCLFVAETAGQLVGFAGGMVVVVSDDVMAELESVAVAGSFRRKGVAKTLCGAVIEWARSCGAREIDLEVRSGNAEAIRLYEGLRFVVVGRRVTYYREPEDDAVLMRLLLSN